MKVMAKRIVISLPARLYFSLRKAASVHYQTVSGFIRESIVEKIEDEFTPGEIKVIETGRKEMREEKGVEWRKARRG